MRAGQGYCEQTKCIVLHGINKDWSNPVQVNFQRVLLTPIQDLLIILIKGMFGWPGAADFFTRVTL